MIFLESQHFDVLLIIKYFHLLIVIANDLKIPFVSFTDEKFYIIQGGPLKFTIHTNNAIIYRCILYKALRYSKFCQNW